MRYIAKVTLLSPWQTHRHSQDDAALRISPDHIRSMHAFTVIAEDKLTAFLELSWQFVLAMNCLDKHATFF